MRPIFLGILASLFFASTFVLNRFMEVEGGSWVWSAVLRFVFMIPFLLFIVYRKRKVFHLIKQIKQKPWSWLLWSTVGFGLFYAPLCFAAAYGPGWLIAGTWQITILSGSLLAPLFYARVKRGSEYVLVRGRIPYRSLLFSSFILLGVIFMQIDHATEISLRSMILCVLPILIASFAYPLGNRKMMEVCEGKVDPYERLLGMTLASMPFWGILTIYGLFEEGVPSVNQTVQSLIVALLSGVCATALFFAATDLVKHDMQKLGAVEATQSFEVLFALLGEVLLLSAPLPTAISWIGILFVVGGMMAQSYASNRKIKKDQSLSV
jgi:drug/metabolite transporter (DMT)-like permease